MLRAGGAEQRRSFVRPLLRGDAGVWRSLADAGAAVDPDSAPLRAVRDGDVYVVSGESVFAGGLGAPDYLWTLAVTDPEAPPATRLSAFLIPAAADGIVFRPVETAAAGRRAAVTFNSVSSRWTTASARKEKERGVCEPGSAPDAAADRLLSQQRALVSRLAEHVRGQKGAACPLSPGTATGGGSAHPHPPAGRSSRRATAGCGSPEGRTATSRRSMPCAPGALHAALVDKLFDALGPRALLLDPEWAPLDGDAALLQSVEAGDGSIWEVLPAGSTCSRRRSDCPAPMDRPLAPSGRKSAEARRQSQPQWPARL